jgi:hypothetical protein
VPRWDRGDLDALLLEVALLFGDEEHRMVAAHDVVELNADLIGGQSGGAGEHGQSGGDRQNFHQNPLALS